VSMRTGRASGAAGATTRGRLRVEPAPAAGLGGQRGQARRCGHERRAVQLRQRRRPSTVVIGRRMIQSRRMLTASSLHNTLSVLFADTVCVRMHARVPVCVTHKAV
jgi:hypothetical protein